MADTLPMIDMRPALNGGLDGLNGFAAAIGRAARDVGFFYLTGHGIDAELIERVFEQSAAFFARPLYEKDALSITRSPHNRGYVAMKGESLDPSKPSDLKEAFNIGLELAEDDPRLRSGEPFRGRNLWPDLTGFRRTLLEYFDRVWTTGRVVHRGIAVDLGLDPDFFEDKLDQPMATLRLLHYPPQPAMAEAGQIGAGEHTDYGDVTLLLPDAVGGLEVRRRDGGWIAAPSIPGAFVCNIGDCLMRWTNDVYVSTPHRVVNRGGRERYSVAFFLDPNPDAVIECLPTCVTEARPARYAPIAGAEYLRERLDATYSFRKAAPAEPALPTA
jgi:isopenicillin N synthase-like dioxygenase